MSAAPKKLHLQRTEMSGNRSSCRHSARPSRRLLVVDIATFRAAPEAGRCTECNARMTDMFSRAAIAAARGEA